MHGASGKAHVGPSLRSHAASADATIVRLARHLVTARDAHMTVQPPTFAGLPTVISGNGAVAHVMRHVCGGVIGYPITPSTEISELYEAARAEGGVNVWGKHPFFFEPEGEHSAQSGALGAALTGGQFISNASSSQGILYAMESHYVTVGKKIGGFVLQVAARVVSKHSLNVMAGHDDVYALLSAGYTILFGSNPQEAADLAAIAYRTSALSLIPVANAMDGFSTSHMLSEALLPEPELLREYLGDPAGRIKAPTVAQELLFGAKGRVFQLRGYLDRHRDDFRPQDRDELLAYLDAAARRHREGQRRRDLLAETLAWVPEELRAQWRRQWLNAMEKGTRQMVPALVDVNNPGLTGPVQNQPDFQAGAVDHRTHFVSAVPALVRQAMDEYSDLTGRTYSPLLTYGCDDADYIMVGLGSITDDLQAVLPVLRAQGLKVGVVSVKLLQPFPEAELIEALSGAKAVTVLERSDQTALTSFRHAGAVQGARECRGDAVRRHPGARRDPATDDGDLRPRRSRCPAAAHRRRLQEHGRRHERAADLPGLAVLLQGPRGHHGRDPVAAAGGLPRDRADGAADGAEPRAPAAVGHAHPLPLRRRLRHDRHRQAPHRHPRRRPRHALEVRAQVRLGEERRADQLLHHAESRARAAHERRARGRRDRGLA